jgi:hypothetical protein
VDLRLSLSLMEILIWLRWIKYLVKGELLSNYNSSIEVNRKCICYEDQSRDGVRTGFETQPRSNVPNPTFALTFY